MDDLLDLWGEEKIQAALSLSRRNIDYFEFIAKEMQAMGHNRTALECRSKTKAMRLEYKRVIEERSRNRSSRVSCPYFDELHRILRGDGSVNPKRVSRSLRVQPQSHVLEVHQVQSPEGRTGIVTADLETINSQDIFAIPQSTIGKLPMKYSCSPTVIYAPRSLLILS